MVNCAHYSLLQLNSPIIQPSRFCQSIEVSTWIMSLDYWNYLVIVHVETHYSRRIHLNAINILAWFINSNHHILITNCENQELLNVYFVFLQHILISDLLSEYLNVLGCVIKSIHPYLYLPLWVCWNQFILKYL